MHHLNPCRTLNAIILVYLFINLCGITACGSGIPEIPGIPETGIPTPEDDATNDDAAENDENGETEGDNTDNAATDLLASIPEVECLPIMENKLNVLFSYYSNPAVPGNGNPQFSVEMSHLFDNGQLLLISEPVTMDLMTTTDDGVNAVLDMEAFGSVTLENYGAGNHPSHVIAQMILFNGEPFFEFLLEGGDLSPLAEAIAAAKEEAEETPDDLEEDDEAIEDEGDEGETSSDNEEDTEGDGELADLGFSADLIIGICTDLIKETETTDDGDEEE